MGQACRPAVGTHRYLGSNGSSNACASTSEPTMRWPSARRSSSGCTRSGTWITVIPAASAARVPAGESSSARQRSGAWPSAARPADVRRRLRPRHVATGDHRIEIRQQAGSGQLAAGPRLPRGGGHRTRDRMCLQQLQQFQDARTQRQPGLRTCLIQVVATCGHRIDHAVLDALRAQQRVRIAVAEADHAQEHCLVRPSPNSSAAWPQRSQRDTLAVDHQAVHVEDDGVGKKRQRSDGVMERTAYPGR